MNIYNKIENAGIGTGEAHARFRFIELFAGIGGFRIGLQSLGGKCVYAVERDKFARETYKAWFRAPPEGCDIDHIDRAAIPEHTILVAGFPCPAFSKAGEAIRKSLGRASGLDAEEDGRHIFTIVEILYECRPPAFIAENVKNLLQHKKGETWSIIRTLLTEAGYSVFAKVLNAKHFGVPQSRERAIIVGFDKGSVPPPIDFRFPSGAGHPTRLIDILEEPDSAMTISERAMRGHENHAARHKEKGNGFGFKLVDVHEVGPTLPAHYAKGGKEILIPQEGIMPRKLSPREAARYMGFPDHLPIVVSNTQAYKQFGNAVVPAIIQAVGAEVLRVLERRVRGA